MKSLLFFIAFLLVSCAPPYKPVVASDLKTLNDFSRAKNQIAENLLSDARDMDYHVCDYAKTYVRNAREIQNRLSVFDTNVEFLSVEESEMLTLALIAKGSYDELFYNKYFSDSITQLSGIDSIVYPFLYLIDHHEINLKKQKTKKILNGNSKKTLESLAEGVHGYFTDAMELIARSSFSDEEKEIMLFYARILMVRYDFFYYHVRWNFKEVKLKEVKVPPFGGRNDWLVLNKKNFLQYFPNTKYRSFLENMRPITIED